MKLKWSGFKVVDTTLEKVQSCVGKGWHKLIEDLIKELETLGWDGTLLQVKEKYGGLRFYIGYGNDALWKCIQKYEKKSYEVCEWCGKPGESTDSGWIKTLCKECENSRFG